MGTSRATTPKPPDPRDKLEVLRSVLVADIVIAALEDFARGEDNDHRPIAAPVAAVLMATAGELRDWHAAKPEQNGAS